MDDTVKEAAAVYSGMISGLSGEERIIMALNSFSVAKEMVIASVPEIKDAVKLREVLLKRFYGDELTDDEIKKIAETYLMTT